MSIEKKDIEHVARLARLALKDEEKERLARDVGGILDYIAKLNEIDTKNIAQTAAEHAAVNQWRADETGDSGIQEQILSQAPKRKHRFFEVKGIFE